MELSNAQEAFDIMTLGMSEILEEVKPAAAIEFAQWNLEIAQQKQLQVTAFSTSFDPGKKFEVTVKLGGGIEIRKFETDLS